MKNNIRVERAVLRISQQQLADAVGVSRQTIYAIENGRFIPSTELALRLSAYFGKTVNELFSWIECGSGEKFQIYGKMRYDVEL